VILLLVFIAVACLFVIGNHYSEALILLLPTLFLLGAIVHSGVGDYPELLAKKNEILAMENRLHRRMPFYDQSALRATVMLTEAEYNFELTKSQYYKSNWRTILFADGLFIDSRIMDLKLIQKRRRR